MELPPRLKDAGFRALNATHAGVLRVSGGRLGRRAFGMDVVELRTIGRRSGQVRTTMLTAPVTEGATLVLVASKGGDHRDPDWFKNLVVQPNVEVHLRGATHAMRARVANDDEVTTLWPQVVAKYRSYDGYRRRAMRVIPLVICEPRDDEPKEGTGATSK